MLFTRKFLRTRAPRMHTRAHGLRGCMHAVTFETLTRAGIPQIRISAVRAGYAKTYSTYGTPRELAKSTEVIRFLPVER